MSQTQLFADGEQSDVLICFTDIAGFARIAREKSQSEVVELLKTITTILSECVDRASGNVVKHIGDSSLLVFPESAIDAAIINLKACKEEIEGNVFHRFGVETTISFDLHFGEVTFAKLPPFETLDVLGDTVNIAASLDKGQYRGKFVVTSQVFRKLKPETRKLFHKFTPPVVYISE